MLWKVIIFRIILVDQQILQVTWKIVKVRFSYICKISVVCDDLIEEHICMMWQVS